MCEVHKPEKYSEADRQRAATLQSKPKPNVVFARCLHSSFSKLSTAFLQKSYSALWQESVAEIVEAFKRDYEWRGRAPEFLIIQDHVAADYVFGNQNFFDNDIKEALAKAGYKDIEVVGGPGGGMHGITERIRTQYPDWEPIIPNDYGGLLLYTFTKVEYCDECKHTSPNEREKWGKAEARCHHCGARCCSTHWLYRGNHVKVTETGKCGNCDYEDYKNTPWGM